MREGFRHLMRGLCWEPCTQVSTIGRLRATALTRQRLHKVLRRWSLREPDCFMVKPRLACMAGSDGFKPVTKPP